MPNADRLIELLHEAKARPPGAGQDAFIADACGDDRDLHEQIVSMLKADAAEGGSDFLRNVPIDREGNLVTEKPGDRIGRYKLLQQIGEGGCGVVYMAEQEEPVRRRIALKVIKLGMDTKQVIARFEAERQALAMMDHPNIAKVLDAGATDTGRPYFVMELVRGIKITDFCDENNVSTEERLKLFILVCQAIQHAHQKGIIHRDIKPSNILVTINEPGSPGCPKVIDFGIAKATTGQRLTDKTVFTAFEQFIGTPAYMSPEQAMMTSLDVDTRTDIYALGVLLYELLTGLTPFDAKDLMAVGLDAMRRIIREQEPARPSTRLSTMLAVDLTIVARHRHAEPARLGTLLRGDLDWIVMKALEKNRARRYETASGLATDIQRHLSDEPVSARPPSNFYRLQKLARRNKLAFAAGGAIAAALLIGLCVATIALARERTARSRAEAAQATARKEAEKSAQVAAFLKEMLNGANPYASTGRDRTLMREILDRTRKRIGKDLEDQPEVLAELQAVMGEAYDTIGEYGIAEELMRTVLAAQRKLGVSEARMADTLEQLSNTLRHRNRWVEAEGLIREVLAIRRKLWPGDHDRTAGTIRNLANALGKQGKLEEAETAAREALAMRRRLHGNNHSSVVDSLEILAGILERSTQVVEAETVAREALAIETKLSGGDSLQLSQIRETLSRIIHHRGSAAESITLQREAVATKEKLMGVHHPWTDSGRERLVALLHRHGQYEEAETILRKQLIHVRAPDPNVPSQINARLGRTLYLLASVLRARTELAEARSLAEEAATFYRQHPDWTSNDYRSAVDVLSAVLTDLGDLGTLEAQHRTSVENIRARVPADDPELAFALAWLTHTLLVTQKFAEAEPLARECLTIRAKQIPEDWTTFDARSMLAGSLLGQKKYAEAEPLLLPGYEGMMQREGKIPVKHRMRWRESLQRLVQFYEATGPSEKAAEWKTKLAEFDRTESEKRAAETKL